MYELFSLVGESRDDYAITVVIQVISASCFIESGAIAQLIRINRPIYCTVVTISGPSLEGALNATVRSWGLIMQFYVLRYFQAVEQVYLSAYDS